MYTYSKIITYFLKAKNSPPKATPPKCDPWPSPAEPLKKLESSKNRYVAPNTHAGIGTTKYSNIGCIGAFNIAQVTTAATDPDAPVKSNYII